MDDANNTLNIATNAVQKRSGRRRPVSQDWLITYSDMITLLFTFVLIILKVSDININRFDELREGLSETFLRQDVSTAFKTLAEEILQIKDKYNSIQIESNNKEIVITMDNIDFYILGSASIPVEAFPRLDSIVDTIQVSPYKAIFIEVEGHTDDLPINNARYPSNWELSTARATNIVKYFAENGLPQDRMRAIGYADSRPLFQTLDSEGNIIPDKRSLNRRIVIKIKPRD